MDIFVSSVPSVPVLLSDYKIEYAVSLLEEKQSFFDIDSIQDKYHYKVKVSDITQEVSNLGRNTLISLFDFFMQLDYSKKLLINCMHGNTYSTSVAYILLNIHYKNIEKEISIYLRKKIPYAIPNLYLIRLADDLLGRNGQMVSAIKDLPPPQVETSFEITNKLTLHLQ